MSEPKTKPEGPPIPIELPPFALRYRAISFDIPPNTLAEGRQIASFSMSGDERLISEFAAAFQNGSISILLIPR